MPIVNGVIHAAGRDRMTNYDSLNVLLLDGLNPDVIVFLLKLNTLHVYIEETLGRQVRIKVHGTPVVTARAAEMYGISIIEIPNIDENTVKNVVVANDIDLVMDLGGVISKEFGQESFYVFQTNRTLSELIRSCEEFLVGHDIPWLFSDISWNMELMMRYIEKPGLCKDFFFFMSECTTVKNYTVIQQDKVRYITNRIAQIEYSKDILKSYVQRLRKAERNGYADQEFNFELNYHLGNYYFLIAGALDSTARLLNDVLRLNLGRHALALEKNEYIAAHRRKRTGYVRILTNAAFVNWIIFLKKRRNFIAHDGDMRQSPLVEQNNTTLTDDEVADIVNGQADWALAARISSPEVVRVMRAQAAEIVRIQQDYTIIAKNVMIVPDDDGTKLYLPLPSIDYDYEQLNTVLSKILTRLKG